MKNQFVKILVIFAIQLFYVLVDVYAQDQQKSKWFDSYYPKVQYEVNGINNISVGLGFPKVHSDITIWRVNGPFVDCGMGFKNQTYLLTNKVGYEYYYLIFAGRLNFINYTNFSANRIAFRPEIGFTAFTKLTITYGYNFFFRNDAFNVMGHTFSINIGIL